MAHVVKVFEYGLVNLHEHDLLVDARWKPTLLCFLFFAGFDYDYCFRCLYLGYWRHIGREYNFFSTLFRAAKEFGARKKVPQWWTTITKVLGKLSKGQSALFSGQLQVYGTEQSPVSEAVIRIQIQIAREDQKRAHRSLWRYEKQYCANEKAVLTLVLRVSS